MKTRRDFLVSAIGASVVAGAGDRLPNVIYITSDQQRWDELRCYGNQRVQTPHLDRLAREGVRFEQAFTQSAVCLPSRICMLTGRYPHTHRVRGNQAPLPQQETTLADVLKRQGYLTAAVGKLESSMRSRFDYYQVQTAQRTQGRTLLKDLDRITTSAVFSGDEEKHWDTETLRTAQRMLRDSRSRPLFLYLSFHQPHRVIAPLERFAQRYRPAEMSLPASFEKGFRGRTRWFEAECRKLGWDRLSREEVQTIVARRLASAEMLDFFVGELRQTVEQLGQAENTVLIYQSDHGDYAGEFGVVNKTPISLADALLHVPLILWAPGRLKPSAPVRVMVEEVDVLPTVLALCGLSAPPGVQGRSLVPLIKGRDPAARAAVFAEKTEGVLARMIRTAEWKLIYCQSGEHELYHLSEDPGETRNLYGSHPGIERELMERLLAWTLETQDRWPATKRPSEPREL